MKTTVLLLSAALLVPAFASAEPLEAWTVAALGEDGEAPTNEEVAALRGALTLELSARGRGTVLDPALTRLRWGAEADLPSVRELLDTAELYYFQLELEAARRFLDQAIFELPSASGKAEAWEWMRDARMLRAMIHLAAGDEGAEERAQGEFAAIVRVDPAWRPPDTDWPPQALELYDRVRRSEQVRQAGRVRVDCSSDCAGASVFADGRRIGAPAQVIALPPGRYRVVVADGADNPSRRSLVRDVEIEAGREVVLSVDLGTEARLAEGTTVLASMDPQERRARASLAARHAGGDFLLLLHHDEAGQAQAWVLDADGRLRGSFRPEEGSADAHASIATQVAQADLAAPAPDAKPEVSPAYVEDIPSRDTGTSSPGLQAARWGTLGAALVAGGLGTWMHVDAAQRDSRLGERLNEWNGALPTERAAAAARTEADAIVAQQAWGTGLLVGAGTLGVTALVLFLVDGESEAAPTIRW